MSLILRQPRTSQPQGSVSVDANHPLARGLVHAFVMRDGVGFDAAQSLLMTPVNSPGVAINRDGVSSYAGVSSNAGRSLALSKITSLAECTMLSLGRPTGALFSTTCFGGCGSSGSNNPLFMLGAGPTSSQLSFRVRNLANVNQEVVSTTTELVTGLRVVALGTRSEAGNFQKVYANGKEVGTAAATALGATTFNTFSVTGLQRTTFGLQMESEVNTLMVWNRALTPTEAKAISDNPWQVFAPLARQIWVPVAAAGGSPYTLTADVGAVPIAGTDTGLAFNRTIIAEAASLAINGTATGLAFNRVLTADTANLALTGNAATLTYTPIGGPTYTLTADTANTAIAGADAGLAFNRKLIADTSNLPISGTDAGLARGYTLAADSGALGISGSDAALIAVRKLIADSYALAIAGADATLTYTPLTLPTIGRPASDTSNTGWTASSGSDLYAMLDEVTPSDADYISASSVGAVCKMALGTTAYPGTASQVLKYRASSSTGNSVIVRLKEGATTIRAETQLLTSVDTEYSITLTSGEIAAITSGSLSVELESA